VGVEMGINGSGGKNPRGRQGTLPKSCKK